MPLLIYFSSRVFLSQSPLKNVWKEFHGPLKLLIDFDGNKNEVENNEREAKLEVLSVY